MTLYKIHELINSEGTILEILKDESGTLYMCGKTDKGRSRIICKTSTFIIQTYLQSRITLKELYLLNQDHYYFIIKEGQAIERFFQISTEEETKEITGLNCGNDLYELLPKSMRSTMTTNEIMDILPDSISVETPEEIEELKPLDADVEFFNEGPISTVRVQFEIYNDDEHDYIMCSTWDGRRVLTRINPYSLFLFLNNRLSIKELFKCRHDDFYYIIDEDSTIQTRYTEEVEVILKNLRYSDLTYFSLPAKIQIENPIEHWKFYTDYITISGKGIIPSEYNYSSPINIQII